MTQQQREAGGELADPAVEQGSQATGGPAGQPTTGGGELAHPAVEEGSDAAQPGAAPREGGERPGDQQG